MGMVIGSEGMAHGARHAGPGEFGLHLLLGGGVSVEEQVADPHLLHKHIIKGLELLGRMLGLVRRRGSGVENDEQGQPQGGGGRRKPQYGAFFHGSFLLDKDSSPASLPPTDGRQCGGSESGWCCLRRPNRPGSGRLCPSATSYTHSPPCRPPSWPAWPSPRRRSGLRDRRAPWAS